MYAGPMGEYQVITLPDGSVAVLIRSMTWGEAVIILLLVALVVLRVYEFWARRDLWRQPQRDRD